METNKKEYRAKRSEEIARMKNSMQKTELHSFYSNLHEDTSDSTSYENEALNGEEEKFILQMKMSERLPTN